MNNMPNWVSNEIHMRNIGINTKLYNNEGNFDFNSVIPMPESVLNTIDGSETNIAIKLVLYIANQRYYLYSGIESRLFDATVSDRELILDNSDLLDDIKKYMNWNNIDFDTAVHELIEKGLQYIGNMCMYQHPTWYDWACRNWDTKWNASSTEVLNDNCVRFNTAWNVPEAVLLQLSQIYPYDEIIDNWIEEGGMCGITSFYNGEKIQDDTYIIDWKSMYDEDGESRNALFAKVVPYQIEQKED